MSWLSNVVNSAAGWGGEDPIAVLQRQQAAAAQAAAAQAAAEEAARQQAMQVTAQATNVAPVQQYSGPTAEAKLQALLPTGFESTLIPSSAADPFIESTLSSGKSSAQALIDNMIKRGTVTGSGSTMGLDSITAQDPAVREKLTNISNTLLENERANLRGIANEGYGAAAGQSGEFFDPTPYGTRTSNEATQFLGGLGDAFSGAVGDVGSLYSTGNLGAASGAATDSRNVSFDPYAVEGGSLSTGIDEGEVPPSQAKKKRSTSVF